MNAYRKSAFEFIRVLGRWFWMLAIGELFGILGLILDITRWDGFSTWVWLTAMALGIVAATFYAFNHVRLERDSLSGKLGEQLTSAPARLARTKARLREIAEEGRTRIISLANYTVHAPVSCIGPTRLGGDVAHEWKQFDEWKEQCAQEVELLLGAPARSRFIRCFHGTPLERTYRSTDGPMAWFEFHSAHLYSAADSLVESDFTFPDDTQPSGSGTSAEAKRPA
ncbi:MAG: hypothetical protein SGJ19_28750 [Planctomycetia bacterium]|nr:hypothetical protein [Planctomycetia bacterium]